MERVMCTVWNHSEAQASVHLLSISSNSHVTTHPWQVPHGTFSPSSRDSKPSWLPPAPLSILLCLFNVFFSTWALTVYFSEGNYVPSLFLVYTLFLTVPISITLSISCVLMTQTCMSSPTLFSQLQTLPISLTHTLSPTKCPGNHTCPIW